MPGFCRSVKASILAGMDLPIRFPNNADVIAEDAARFRALSPEKRVHELNDCFRLYRFLRMASGRPEHIDRLAEEEKRLEWKAILEFAARHGFIDYDADRVPSFAEQTEPDFVVDIKSHTNV